jgi:transposase-like protein
MEKSKTSNRYSAEVRSRAVRMVLEHGADHGVAFGRPKKMRPDQQQLARELVRDGKSISAVARTFDVHPATIYRVIEP